MKALPRDMTEPAWLAAIKIRPRTILTSNTKLAKDRIWNLTLPAAKVLVEIDSKPVEFITCPGAGQCLAFCYAQSGSYVFHPARVKHARNLQWMLDDPFTFTDKVIKEVKSKRTIRALRFNDSGDIWGDGYWGIIKAICAACPDVQCYAYTKAIKFFKDKPQSEMPVNFTLIFSYGGKFDSLIDTATDRHSKVFATRSALRKAGYSDGTHTDRIATNPLIQKVGLVVHGNHLRMPKLRKLIAANNSKNKFKDKVA